MAGAVSNFRQNQQEKRTMNQSHHESTKTTLTCKEELNILDKKIGTFLF